MLPEGMEVRVQSVTTGGMAGTLSYHWWKVMETKEGPPMTEERQIFDLFSGRVTDGDDLKSLLQ